MPKFVSNAVAVLVFMILPSTSSYSGEIKRLPLDEISTLGMTIEKDSTIKAEGDSSVKITTRWPATINIGEVSDLSNEGATLVYEARVRSEKLSGNAYLEMWCFVDGKPYFSRGLDSTVTGTTEWQTLRTPFLFQESQRAEKAVLNIVINGSGVVWVDDIQLTSRP